ncbi:energy transducer TonB [Flavobacterium sp. K77]|uniref:energy transducer TonB n=1 Tax=Flavobacterium sp. K77 TaxID=2910676 RepID=UPI001F4281A3|nr:energy transducer TonB [Flavobacterium sp. K77]MCF6142486.1 energy transducer TonB [Flavobacterium sp. K77]
MKILIYLIIALLLSNAAPAQEITQEKDKQTKDTLKGRHFGDFIKPANDISKISVENSEMPYFKKCIKVESAEDRRTCLTTIFYETLRKKLHINNNIEKGAKVDLIVEFVISKTGKVEDIKIVESNDPTGNFEKEVIRVLNKLPDLVPAKKDGKLVRVLYNFPISVSNPL